MVVVAALLLWIAAGNDGAAASGENFDLDSDRKICGETRAGEVDGGTKLDSWGRRCVRCVAPASELNELLIGA